MKHSLLILFVILSISSTSFVEAKTNPVRTAHPITCTPTTGVNGEFGDRCIHRPRVYKSKPTPAPTPVIVHQARPSYSNVPYRKLTYNSERNEWSLSATVIQLKNGYLPGGPVQLAQVEYLSGPCWDCTLRTRQELGVGKPAKMWIVVSVGPSRYVGNDVFHFANQELAPGDTVLLTLSGPYVSKAGVNWEKCPYEDDDRYCYVASMDEYVGGYAIDHDYLPVSTSNDFLWSGHGPAGWDGGALCWKITVISGGVSGNLTNKAITLETRIPQ